MHIAIDATCWQNQRGYGRHARALLSALVRLDREDRYTFFLDADADAIPSEVEVRQVRAAAPAAVAAAANGHRSLPDMLRMTRALSQPGFDVVLFPTVYSYVPVLSRARKIVVIHDVIAETYPDLTLPRRSARAFWNAKVALACRQADAIVTVSDFSRQGIAEHFDLDPARIFVVGEAGDPVFRVLENPQLTPSLAARKVPATGRIVATVGGFGPHKNLETLVGVFARIAAQPEFADVILVMVGEYQKEVFHSAYAALKRQVEALGIAERVVFPGYLPDEELVTLLNRSTVLALPSLMEGFGLPAIEAAACGCPVIATTASPLPDLLGAGGVYVNPTAPEELEEALVRVLSSESLRQEMRAAGLAAARALTWERAAHQMLDVIAVVSRQ
jgi:glycosyltransferase involved in cell wall biosynthesis